MIQDKIFVYKIEKKSFLVNFLNNNNNNKSNHPKVVEFIRGVFRHCLSWISESMVPNLFKFETITGLELYKTILGHVEAAEDAWRRELLQNKYYYTSVMYKGMETWTIHIAKYIVDDEEAQWSQPYISVKITGGDIELWNHNRTSTVLKKTNVLGLVENADFQAMLTEIGAGESDVYLLGIILLFKMYQSKNRFKTAPLAASATTVAKAAKAAPAKATTGSATAGSAKATTGTAWNVVAALKKR
jgi:hypothetical protein